MKENITLGDIATIQTGPFGSQLHASDYVENGIPVIMPTNIGNNLNIEVDAIAKINEDDLYRLSRYQVYEDDIVYSRRGDVERCAFITKSQNNWLCGTGCLRVRFKKGDIVPKFFAYQLSTDEAKGWISGHAVGSTMSNLNSSILAQVPLFKLDVEEQRAIAAVLSSLDDKIDLLHRQNATLEAMAEALFRQWFVVEAKEEWEEKKLSDLINLVGGGTPKTSLPSYWGGTIPWLSGGDISCHHKKFIFSSEKFITEAGLNNSATRLVPKYATIITARGTVGKFCLAAKSMSFSQTNYGVMPKDNKNFFFTFLLIDYIVNILKSAAYGSVFDTITSQLFDEVSIALPSKKVIEKFDLTVGVFFEKIFSNQKQIQTLEKLRDALLPKLMSGEVRVDF